MKAVKRILAIIFLILTILVIGYLVHTGSRLFSNESNLEDYKGTFYQYNNKEYFLEITDTLNANFYTQGVGKELIYESFEDGILTYKDNETMYHFATVPDGLYDLQLNIILGRN